MPDEPVETRGARRRREPRRPVGVVAAAAGVCVAAVVIAALMGGGGDDPGPAVAVGTTAVTGAPIPASTVPPTEVPTVPPTEAPTVPPPPDPGDLPQTQDKPTTTSAGFQEHMQQLWQAIVSDDPSVARPAFFPLGAYRQVKAISNPDGDYSSRLIAAYDEDIHALHAKLGSQAAGAQLTGVDVPDAQAVWVEPGVEYNKGSYWRVYGTTLHYTTPDGRSGAFPIASLISWRGEWYVVHLSSIR